VLGGSVYFFLEAWKRDDRMQAFMDRVMRKLPVFGILVEKSCIARWTRTLSTMFAAGVPLVEALDSVGGAAGNVVYSEATQKIQQEVSTGTALTAAMSNVNLFPSMVLQMCAIGEESGSIDHMLSKCADFYEAEVDDMVAGISSLMEPIIIVLLGTDHRWHRGVHVPSDLQTWAGGVMLSGIAGLDAGIFALIGLLVGSFLNVVVYRLPQMLERQWAAECAQASGGTPQKHPR